MAGNDTPTGVGRGTSRGISRGRRVRGTTLSSGRGMAATTPSHSIVGQASNPSTSHTTTNTQLPHSTSSPPISQTPSTNASDADPHVSSNDMDSSPNIEDPLDDRIWIRPGPENTFNLAIAPTRAIIKIIQRKFTGCWTKYGELKAEEKKTGMVVGFLLKCVRNWMKNGVRMNGKGRHKLTAKTENLLMLHSTLEGRFNILDF